MIHQRIGRVQSITPQRDWHPLGALIFQFLVAFSGVNLTLAELNATAETMLVRGRLEGIVITKLEISFLFLFIYFSILFEGFVLPEGNSVQLSSAAFILLPSSQTLCPENQQQKTSQGREGPKLLCRPPSDKTLSPFIHVQIALGIHFIKCFAVDSVYSKDIANCPDIGTASISPISKDTEVQSLRAHCKGI